VLCLAGSSLAVSGGASVRAASPPGVYTFDASKNALKTLIPGGIEREDISWSSDGKWVASTNTDNFLVDVVPAAGGKRRAYGSLSWSPNGTRAAYTTTKGLIVSASNFQKPRLVTAQGSDGSIEWAPDSGAFTFGGRQPGTWLRVSRGDGTGVRKLWLPPSDGPGASWINDVSWSPSGRRLALWVTINNAVAKRNGGEFVYLVSPDHPGARRVTYRAPDGLGFYRWSGDGKWLILRSEAALYRVSPSGGATQALCGSCVNPELSPDGRRVAYVSRGGLWSASVDGSGAQRIGDVPAQTEISWSADSRKLGLTLTASEDGPAHVAAVDLTTNTIRPLTDGTKDEYLVGLSSTGSYAAFFTDGPPTLWVVGTAGGAPRAAMQLATGELGPCPEIEWSPTAPVLAIANAKCEPS
jgi:Tol biopolymer transport system component